jgi:hypothetical protein
MRSPRFRLSHAVAALAVLMACAVAASISFASSRPMEDPEHRDARRAAVRLLTVDAAARQMPSDLRERDRAFRSGAEDRRRLLASVWAPSALDQRVRETEAGWTHVLRDREYKPYSDNRYVVTDWREVKDVRAGVLVVVRGHMEYQDSATGRWHGSADGTELLTLTRVDGDWQLLREVLENYNPS